MDRGDRERPGGTPTVRDRSHIVLLILGLGLGLYARLIGLDWGTSDFVLPEHARQGVATAFYQFHPDERTLVHAALTLRSPFDPPTAYGMLPLYLLTAGLELSSALLSWNAATVDHPETARQVYLTARFFSALLSCACLALVWWLGRRHFDRWTGGLALFFVAAAPLAVQLAHFATVDGVFTFFCLLFFCLLARALDLGRRRDYLFAGLAVAAVAAVRLNGLLLGGVLLAGHLLQNRSWRALRDTRLWLAGLAAVLLLILLQPFLVTEPSVLWRAESTYDLGFSLKIARGEILRPWSLVDLHTLPYLHYWTHLFPLGVGWPLTLAFLLGAGHALWHRHLAGSLMLLWIALYFAQVGGLHTKHVRYLLPLLPFLCLLTANACVWLIRTPKTRLAGYGLTGLLLFYTGIYGLAFTRIYADEDSRIVAGRWLAARVPSGSEIGVERGGFPMSQLIDGQRHPRRLLNLSPLFEGRGLMTCRSQRIYLQDRLRDLEYIAITDVNRYQQFLAAPELLPALATFYRDLIGGKLGYDLVQRFKRYPAIAGIQFKDDGAEPSFIGYDHPAVFLFKRRSAPEVERGLEHLDGARHCADALLQQGAAALREGALERAMQNFREVVDSHPDLDLVHLLIADAHRRAGRQDRERESRERYRVASRRHSAHVLPFAAGMGLVDLDLPDLAREVLIEGTQKAAYMPSWAIEDLATAYVLLANIALERDQHDLAWDTYRLSTRIDPNSEAFNRLGFLAYRAEDFDRAIDFWDQSVRLQDNQASIHSNLGQILAAHRREQELDRALHHLTRAVQLDPGLSAQLNPWIDAVRSARQKKK